MEKYGINLINIEMLFIARATSIKVERMFSTFDLYAAKKKLIVDGKGN